MSATDFFKKIQDGLDKIAIGSAKAASAAATRLIWDRLRENPNEASPTRTKNSNAPKTASFLFDSCDYICLICRNHFPKQDRWTQHIKKYHHD